VTQAHALLRLVLGKHKMGIFSLPVADVERIEAELSETEAAEAAKPPAASDSLARLWEMFSEEQRHAQVEVGPARKAFYAGAQAFVGIVAGALEMDDAAYDKLIEETYEELSQACEELKI
jgi:hypothetical protein